MPSKLLDVKVTIHAAYGANGVDFLLRFIAQSNSRSWRRSFRMTVKEVEFDAQHFIEAHSALVDVVVAAATAVELAEWRFFGKAYRRTDRRHRILLGNNKQEGTADGGGAANWPTPRKAEQRTRGDAITPFGRVLRGHELLAVEGIFGRADCQVSGAAGARQIERG